MCKFVQRSRDLNSTSLAAFSPETNAAKYLSRRNERLADYAPNVPVCESIAIENAAICNARTLDDAEPNCPLPEECASATVRYYCKRDRQTDR